MVTANTESNSGPEEKKTSPKSRTTLVPDAPEWAVGFEDEEYPDIIVVGEGEKLVARFLDSNIIPLPSLDNPQVLVDTEVIQCEILNGTTVRNKELVDGEVIELPGVVESGEIRSFWINSYMLRKNVEEWNLVSDDEFAVFNKGKVKGRNQTYNKILMTVKGKTKYKRERARTTTRESAGTR
jgi:hypothetical protein